MKTATPPRVAETRAPGADPQRRLLLAVGLLIAAFLIFFPTKQLLDQRGRIAQLEQRLAALQEHNDELAHELRQLEDPEELELVARERLGLVRPGEQAYLFVSEPEQRQEAETPAPHGDPLWERVWGSVLRFLRGSGP